MAKSSQQNGGHPFWNVAKGDDYMDDDTTYQGEKDVMLIEPMEFYPTKPMPQSPDGLIHPMEFFEPFTDGKLFSEEAGCEALSFLGAKAEFQLAETPEKTQQCALPTQQVPSRSDIQSVSQNASGSSALATQPVQPELSTDGTKPTPYGTAQKFMKMQNLMKVGSQLRRYNGAYYEELDAENAQNLIVEHCREDVKAAGSASFTRSVYEYLLIEPELVKRGLEANSKAVSFLNGILLLDTGELVAHSPMFYTTYCVQFKYLGSNVVPICPHFDGFLNQSMGGDQGLIDRVYQMLGYALTADTNGKVFFLLQGVPNAGKSVISAFIGKCFNDEAVTALDVHDLGARFAVSELSGKAVCISPDLPAGVLDAKAVSALKKLTGNDLISADVKYRDRVQFRCTAKFILATNHPLLTKLRDDALVERIVAIPFLYSVPKERQNPMLLAAMQQEGDAIVTKAIHAYFRLAGNQYRFSGDYQLNSVPCLYSNDSQNVDFTSSVYGFVQQYYTYDEGGVVFTDEAYRLFLEQIRPLSISLSQFSSLFSHFAKQLCGGTKDRKRRNGGDNPLSCITGIRLQTEGVLE